MSQERIARLHLLLTRRQRGLYHQAIISFGECYWKPSMHEKLYLIERIILDRDPFDTVMDDVVEPKRRRQEKAREKREKLEETPLGTAPAR